ncbi:MAG: Hsp20/alpha crystallin family protein [Elusimicrobiota bacterium]
MHIPDTVGSRTWVPPVEVKETDKEYILCADLPGLTKKDIKVSLDEGVLTLRGERQEKKESKDKGYLMQEQYYGSFQRSFVLPDNVKAKDVKASYKDGLLQVILPRTKETKQTSREVEIV